MKNLETRVGSESKKGLKVMTYNALHGFVETTPPFRFEEGRFDAFKSIVEREDPDILLLTEACYGHDNEHGRLHNYAEMLGFPHQAYGKKGNSYWGSAILSKYPFVSGSTKNLGVHYNGDSHEEAHITSKINLGRTTVQVDLAHPVPFATEDEKNAFFEQVLKNRTEDAYILGGDFNAWSPQDQTDRNTLIRGFSKFPDMDAEKARRVVDDAMQKKAIATLLRAGLVDTYRAVNSGGAAYTSPTILEDNPEARLRLDYIFTDPSVKVSDSRIIQDEVTDKASDHYPVVSTLNIS